MFQPRKQEAFGAVPDFGDLARREPRSDRAGESEEWPALIGEFKGHIRALLGEIPSRHPLDDEFLDERSGGTWGRA